MTQNIWLLRHGNRHDFVHPEWFNSAPKRYDPPLSEDGMIQVQNLANKWQNADIKHIFASPFLRTIQTAHPIAENLHLKIKLEAGLGEWHNPEWMSEAPEIHSREELEKDYPLIDWGYSSQIVPQYPENDSALHTRLVHLAQLLTQQYSTNLLLVAHSDTVAGIANALLFTPQNFRIPVGSYLHLQQQERRWALV